MSDIVEPTNAGIETPPAPPALVEAAQDTGPTVTVTPYKVMAVFVTQKRVDGVVVDELTLTNTESPTGLFEAFGVGQLSSVEARMVASAEAQLNAPPETGPAADAAALLAPQ